MKSKITKIQILKKGILLILMLAMLLPSSIYAVEGLTLQASTALEKLIYGEIGSVVNKIEEHFKSNTTLYIVNETQLRAFAEYVNSGNSCQGKRIELLNDIKLNTDTDWTPIGNYYSEFSGTFDGNGYTITNLTYKCLEDYVTEGGYFYIGLFGVISKHGTVQNVNVFNSNIVANGLDTNNIFNVGNIAGTNYGNIVDCWANIMPITKETKPNSFEGPSDYLFGTEDNNYIGLIAGESEGSFSFSTNVQPSTTLTLEDGSKINIDLKVYKNNTEITDFLKANNFKIGDTIKLKFILDTYLYTDLENGKTIKLSDELDKDGNITKEAPKENYPLVTVKNTKLKLLPVSSIQEEIELEDGNKKPQTTLVYEYTVTNEEKIKADNVSGHINFEKNIDNENLYVYYSEDAENFYTGDRINKSATGSNLQLNIDSILPSVEVEASVEELSESNRYAEGKEIIIKVKSTEKIQATIAPEINVSFSESGLGKYNYQENKAKGNALHVDALLDGEGKTTWIYSYIIEPGDEGILNLEYLSGTITDLVGNKKDITELKARDINSIYADTTAPTLEIIRTKDLGNVYDFNGDEMTNGEDLIILFQYIAKYDLGEAVEKKIQKKGDIDNNNVINLIDVQQLGNEITATNNITNESKISYIIQLSENVEGFDASDITVNNGSIIKINQYQRICAIVVETEIEDGNIGDVQVIVEQDACQDLVGHGNVRTESVMRVDRKAPALQTLEAHAQSDITLNSQVDVVKEYYKTGEKITVVATFDENITAEKVPELVLQFNESGKSVIPEGKIEGNKIIYTYTIADGDEGTVSVRALNGTVVDAAGNETKVTRKALDGNTIIVDTKAPSLNELNVTTNPGTYNAGKTITIEAIYDEEVYALKDNEIKNISSESAPTLMIKFGNGEEREAIFSGYAGEDKTKLIYTCTIVNKDNEKLSITSYENKENIQVCDIAGNLAELNNKQTGNKIIADNIRPEVMSIEAKVENPSISGTDIYHKEGNIVKVTLTFSENVSGANVQPKIKLGFSEVQGQKPEMKEYSTISTMYENSTTIEYTYEIANGDNGYLWVEVLENEFDDIAGNGNVSKEAEEKITVFADTIIPTVTLYRDTEEGQNNQIITIKATFNENVYDLNGDRRVTLTAANAPKLIYSFGDGANRQTEDGEASVSGATITYTITKDPVEDNGTLHYELAKGNLCDRAGNEYYIEKTDTTAPVLESVVITSNAGIYTPYCREGKEIYVIATFDESIDAENMKLEATVGGKEIPVIDGELVEGNSRQIKFTYTVKAGDMGEFKIVDICGEPATEDKEDYGWVRDEYGNQNNIYSLKDEGVTPTGRAEADTKDPYITSIKALVDNQEIATYTKEEGKDAVITVGRTKANIVEYIVTYSEAVKNIDKSNISRTNGIIKDIEYTDFALNEYKITVQTTVEGVQSLIINEATVEDKAGNTDGFVRLDAVTVDFTKPTIRFISEYNGGIYVLPTNIDKVEIRPNVEISEDIAKIEYKWDDGEYVEIENYSTSSDIAVPTKAFTEYGQYELFIKVVDLAGNVAETSKTYEILNSYIGITADITECTKQNVTVTVSFGEGLTDNRKVTFKAEGSEELIELNAIGTNENGTEYTIETNGTIYAEATDRVGNKVFTEDTISNIDKELPVVELSLYGANLVIGTGRDKATIKSTVEVEEANLEGIKYIYSNNEVLTAEEKAAMKAIDNYEEAKTEDAVEGTYYLHVIAVDRAGNETEFKSSAFTVANSNTITDEEGNVTFTPAEENTIKFEREQQYVYVTYGWNLSEEQDITFTKEEDGYALDGYAQVLKPTTVTATASDVCGNTVTATYVVESVEGPEFEVIGNPEEWTNQDVKLEVSTYDALSALTVNGTDILSKEEGVRSSIIVSQNGDYEFIATDIYGNISKQTIKVEKIDKELPVISKVENEGKDIIITATDGGSGVVEYAITSTTEIPAEWSNSNVIKTTKDGTFYAWAKDAAGNISRAENTIVVDTTAPTITFSYTSLTVTVGVPLETNIVASEDAIISYSWDNETWVDSEELLRSLIVSEKSTTTGKYTLYVKAEDEAGNESQVQTLEFNVVNVEEIRQPEIIFEDIPTIQINGLKYVKISSEMTTDNLTDKMNKEALCGKTPEYIKLTEDNKLKTGSEITINGETKYVIVVNGDVDCDGKVTFLGDVVMANNYRIGQVKLTAIQKLAADINNSGNIEFIPDIVAMNNYRLGIIKDL